MELISQYAYAKRVGLSRAYINELIRDGVIPLHNGKINPEEADRILHAKKNTRKAYQEARTLIMNIKAQLLQMELERKKASLVDMDKVIEHLSKVADIVRERMHRIPKELAHILAKEKDPYRCMEILDNEIRQALTELSELGSKQTTV